MRKSCVKMFMPFTDLLVRVDFAVLVPCVTLLDGSGRLTFDATFCVKFDATSCVTFDVMFCATLHVTLFDKEAHLLFS